MKSILVVVAVIVALASAQKFQLMGETGKLVRMAQEACAASEGVDPKFVSQLFLADFPTKEDIKCLSFCVFKKFNVMDDAGVINLEIVKEYIKDPERLNKVLPILKACQAKSTTTDGCQLAYDIHKCFIKVVNQ